MSNHHRNVIGAACGYALLLLLLASTAPTFAQTASVFRPAPRELSQPLSLAKRAIKDGDFTQASQILGQLLSQARINEIPAQDFFLIDQTFEVSPQRLRSEAENLIGALPAAGREAYELQFGDEARALLVGAISDGREEALADVSRRFLHTRAGYTATMILGRRQLAAGHPLAAAITFQRMSNSESARQLFDPELSIMLAASWQQAGETAKAKEVVLDLKRRLPDAQIRKGDSLVSLFSDNADALQWLTELVGAPGNLIAPIATHWLMVGGNSTRTAKSEGGTPLMHHRWRTTLHGESDDEDLVHQLQRRYAASGTAVIPASQPLAVGKFIIMRTPNQVFGVDFETGKRVWQWPWRESPEQIRAKKLRMNSAGQGLNQHRAELTQRLFEDSIHGQMASDGDHLYLVSDLGYASSDNYSSNIRFIVPGGNPMNNPSVPRKQNRLYCLELKSEGKEKWYVGGISGEDEPELAGAFFLGPPLCKNGTLYAIIEIQGEIRLVALDPKTGSLQWQQQLAHVDTNTIDIDSTRRLAGATPSAHGNVLICPTSAGAVVAVDIHTRSFLWGYHYSKHVGSQRRVNIWRTTPIPTKQLGKRWTDATATVAGTKVILTPVEADELHCVDLTTGDRLWDAVKRETLLYVAHASKSHVVLVGTDRIRALDLATGKDTWETPLKDGVPCGRGFSAGDFYYLPLANSTVAKVELSTGKIAESIPSGHPLGNLICYQDQVISQSGRWISTYYQLEPLKQKLPDLLAKNPDDPWALARQGEVLLHDGKRKEAIASLQRSFDLDTTKGRNSTRNLLIETSLDALADDFAGHRSIAGNVAKLVEQPDQKMKYLRLMASGLQKTGEAGEAFKAYMDLAALEATQSDPEQQDKQPLVDIDLYLRCKLDRWIAAKFTSLRSEATPAQREEIDKEITKRLATALESDSVETLTRFLAFFGDHPKAHDVRMRVAEMQIGQSQYLAAESSLLYSTTPDSPEQLRQQMALRGKLYASAGRVDEANTLYDSLAKRWPNDVCWDGKTGSELASQYYQDLKRDTSPAWPVGDTQVKLGADNVDSNASFRRVRTIRITEAKGPLAQNMRLFYDEQRRSLLVRDGYGSLLATVSLKSDTSARYLMVNHNATYGKINGNLLLLSIGFELMGIDLAQAINSPNESAILWRENISPTVRTTNFVMAQRVNSRQILNPWGGTRFLATDASQERIGASGPLNYSGLVYQHAQELICRNPVTGDVIWRRDGVPAGSELFGDEQLLFVVPPKTTSATVYNIMNGEQIGARDIGPIERRWTTNGRRVLCWEDEAEHRTLQLLDVWDERTIWSRKFPKGSRGDLIEQDEVAIVTPTGELVVMPLDGAKPVLEGKVAPEKSLTRTFVLRSDSQYVVIVSGALQSSSSVSVNTAPGGAFSFLVSGNVYAFNREHGKMSWQTPASVIRHGFNADQAPQSPVLLFLRHMTPETSRGNRSLHTSVLCLDKRDGSVVHAQNDIPSQSHTYELQADRDSKTVNIKLPGKRIEIKFTDAPAPPAPAAQADLVFDAPKSGFGQTVGSILRALDQGSRGSAPRKISVADERDIFGD